jgi:Secretion system C-terminal sorting domain
MKKVLYFLFPIFLVGFLNSTSAQTAHKIAIQFWVQDTGNNAAEAYADTITEGQTYTMPAKTLPSNFAGAQSLYDALVGTQFSFQLGSLNQDIVVYFTISDIDLSNATYQVQNSVNLFFDVDFTIEDWSGNVLPEPFNLNTGKYAVLRINKTPAFNTFISKTGLDITTALKFVYETSDGFDLTGITTYDSTNSVTAMVSHFSKIVGGAKSSITAIKKAPDNSIPSHFALMQNYPNPFNPSTEIEYALPHSSYIELNVYNVLGSKVATLVSGTKAAGDYTVNFNASNLSSGVYIYQLKTGSSIISRKMILMK